MNVSDNARVLGLEDYASDSELAQVELFKDYPEALLHFASACCVIYLLIGIPGNLITIIALARCKKVHSILFNFLIKTLKLNYFDKCLTNFTKDFIC